MDKANAARYGSENSRLGCAQEQGVPATWDAQTGAAVQAGTVAQAETATQAAPEAPAVDGVQDGRMPDRDTSLAEDRVERSTAGGTDTHLGKETRHEAAALRSPLAHVLFWTIAASGLWLDLWSKEWAFDTLRQGGHRVIVPHLLEFQTMLNPGALFGIGRGQTTLFVAASVLALLLVFWMFSQSPARRWGLQIALGGILAGAMGNMYDRVFVRLLDDPIRVPGRGIIYLKEVFEPDGRVYAHEYPVRPGGVRMPLERAFEEYGYVRDFIKIPTTFFGRELWPWVFNVADMLLVGGVSILAVYLWRHPPRRHVEHAPAA